MLKKLGNIIKVSNMTGKNYNKIPNQFEIETDKGRVFQSYDSIICAILTAQGTQKTYLDNRYWNYSKTTSKYRNMFLNENTKETEKKIKSGEYILTDLN